MNTTRKPIEYKVCSTCDVAFLEIAGNKIDIAEQSRRQAKIAFAQEAMTTSVNTAKCPRHGKGR